MRGHVEQRRVTANQREPAAAAAAPPRTSATPSSRPPQPLLRMGPCETKGNKAMKHKHEPRRAHSITSETFYDGGDVGPHYPVATRSHFTPGTSKGAANKVASEFF